MKVTSNEALNMVEDFRRELGNPDWIDHSVCVGNTAGVIAKALEEKGYKIYYPDPILCTDNAAMIASAGYYRYISGVVSGLDLNAVPNLKIS